MYGWVGVSQVCDVVQPGIVHWKKINLPPVNSR